MPDILLTTFNARYAHTAFGLRYLMANLGDLQERAEIIEFTCNDSIFEAVERLLAQQPRVIGIGVYIWNIEQTTQLVASLKKLRPEIRLIIGGPEVSYEFESLPIFQLADCLITGEADLTFAEVCRQWLDAPSEVAPTEKVIAAQLPTFGQLRLPYQLYSDQDLRQRTVYVEASRGCPFSCEFCLSSLEIPVRQADVELFLQAMQNLLDRGAQQFKFIDRTFNLNLRISQRILEFFRERYRPGLFLHFEMVPDRLPAALRETIAGFPEGSLQFEVGIQTFNEEVAARIQRRQDVPKLEDNLRFLHEHTGVHVHADLIVGLPGESLESFAAGFDRLIALRPQEIQVGMLKRLRGTPIVRHDLAWEMVYSPYAPYEILQNRLIDFPTMQRLRRFARYWDLIGNSGNFLETCPLIWGRGSPFDGFMRWSDWLYARVGQTHKLALPNLVERLFEFLSTRMDGLRSDLAVCLLADYQRSGRLDRPAALRPYLPDRPTHAKRGQASLSIPPRQARHRRSVDS